MVGNLVPKKIREQFKSLKARMVIEDRESPEYYKQRRKLLQAQKVEIEARYAAKKKVEKVEGDSRVPKVS